MKTPSTKAKVTTAIPTTGLQFSALDGNDDGEIKAGEFFTVFKQLDRDNNGRITSDEFEAGNRKYNVPKPVARQEDSSFVTLGQRGRALAIDKDGTRPATLGLNFIICRHGLFPSRS